MSGMLRNNVRIAWRQLVKDRQFTLLNVFGLTAGLTCSLLIWLWVNDELQVDRFFDNQDRVCQVMVQSVDPVSKLVSGQSDESTGLLTDALKARIPEVQYAAALAPPEWWQKFTLSVGEKNIKAVGQYAGPDYFSIFSFPLQEGQRDKLLTDKNSIVISDELARRLFGTAENVKGKAVRFQQQKDFFVSGVFKKISVHSSTQFDFVLSFDYLSDVQPWVKNWGATGPHNFVLLKKGADMAAVNKKMAGIIRENTGDSTHRPALTKYGDVYLSSTPGSQTGGRMGYVRLFSLIAVFILSIACINFMNLSTAKASRRMKEIGIKKVVGAGRGQLVMQFLTESVLLTLFAMLLAIGIAALLLPQFNQLTGKAIELRFDRSLITIIVSVTLIAGLLAGSYPALYLSGFDPIRIVKGKFQSSWAELVSRRGLVVFQFTMSVILIVSMLVLYEQIQFIQHTNPGYDKENVIRFASEGRLKNNETAFVSELKKIPGVLNAAYTMNNMVGRNFGTYGVNWQGRGQDGVYFEGFGSGYNFFETMGMKMIAGRAFSPAFGADTNKIIFNESAIKLMGLKDPVGKTISRYNSPRQIIGVVKDFHFESLHEPVRQSYFILTTDSTYWYRFMIRLQAGQNKETIARVQRVYEKYNPGFPFDFAFLVEAYQKQYVTENRVAVISRYFAGLAILISCLGLFGLAAFTAQRRQKEIGIRKVIGASVRGISFMLSGEFLKLVLISMLVAFPVAWYAMNLWLQGFAYRITIGPGIFLLAGISVIAVTLLTISFQSVRAALRNPVKSLRSE